MKTVAIIMPAYNSRNIRRSVDAILAQTHKMFELVIIDDASSEKFRGELKEISSLDERISVIFKEVNSGAGASRNLGLQATKHDMVAFCDSDDIWYPTKLEVQLRKMEVTGAAICCTAFVKRHVLTGKVSKPIVPRRIIDHAGLQMTCDIGMSTSMIDREKVGSFLMPMIRRRQDYALWLTLTRQGALVVGLDDCLVEYSYGAPSVSSNKFYAALAHFQVLRNYTKLPLPKLVWCFVFYAFQGLRKYIRR